MDFDLVVIGGGAAGLGTARAGARAKARTLLVSDGPPGGDCTFLGGGRLLGATIVAQRAGEMIHEAVLALSTGMFTGRLAAATHASPTWSYGVQLAAAQFFMTIGGRAARPARK